ncbi:MAG: tetratricopeptide repeat protein [Bacteroidales bacterium]|nr:tetratricopeptide repeat protein [Bacteroidales bacterium]MDD4217209.1 tetratricopeptide repeat protein [Bacteroidales bacterium]MDY0141325.1 tetratricopeptide repeat protein [Bacteroidales bacterium]
MKIKQIYRFILLLIVLFVMQLSGFAQNNDAQLALKYYKNEEYDKAAELYQKLYDETGYKNNRDYYLRCLFILKDYEIAEKFLKKESRKNKSDFYLKIDLGMVYYNSNKFKDAEDIFNEVIELVKRNKNNVFGAAAMFINYRQYSYAEQVYKTGGAYLLTDFNMELGNLYYIQRDYQRMMDYYLEHLKNNPNILNTLQSRLQYVMANDIDGSVESVIETSIFQKIQQEPQNMSFNHLLIWHYTQAGKFRVALNQLYAIDKRTKTGSENDILNFGMMLYENEEFELALEAFDYLMKKGKENYIYNSAYIEYLNVLYVKTSSVLNPDKAELIELEQMLTEALSMVLRRESYKIIYALVNVKAFYLDKHQEAIELIEKSIGEKRFLPEQEQIIKLMLGDIYFLNKNPWDAILVYAQVEKAMLESPIGHEARFRKAKLAYYTGQFKWSQAQLDVLRSSTSKLIANDAMELSLFISENFDLDTTETTMQIFARADFYVFSKQYDLAFKSLDSIIQLYPSHTLIDDVLYKKAQIYEATGNYNEASKLYKEVADVYFYDVLADNALFKYALIQEKLKNTALAEEAYFKLIADYPGSIFTVEARQNLRKLTDAKP